MPNRSVKRNSVVDLLAKVPVNKGSLLTSLENLLKTIESSESAVMIPTLLRDKCDFDAWELLFVAKILKASILGHVDLVEFYMNHIGLNSSQFTASQTNNNTTTNGNGNGNQNGGNNLSDTSTINQSLSPSTPNGGRQSSPILSPTGATPHSQVSQIPIPAASPSQLSSTASSLSSTVTMAQAGGCFQFNGGTNQQQQQQQQNSSVSSSSTSSNKTSSSGSWTTVSQQLQSTSTYSTATGSTSATSSSGGTHLAAAETLEGSPESSSAASSQTSESLLASARPAAQFVRQAQPPSLLQLTTTNNHINSVAAGFTNSTIEQLTNQLSSSLQTNGCLASSNKPQQTNNLVNGLSPDGALSISTAAANQQSQVTSGGVGLGQGQLSGQSGTVTTPTTNGGGSAAATPSGLPPPHAELRSSRSAGCLFRMNSGASSPRTPSTPYPQAETLANGQANGLPGDPSAPVKLLLQIEQLKLSISHVTSLLESVVELYKKSIDNIALA